MRRQIWTLNNTRIDFSGLASIYRSPRLLCFLLIQSSCRFNRRSPKPFDQPPSFRLVRGPGLAKDARIYVNRARESIVLNAAATAWSQGVPWTEALEIASKAIEKASPDAKARPKGKGRGKGKAKGKRHAG